MRKFLSISILLCLPFAALAQCISGNCSNGTGAYQFSNSRYIGEFKNNRAHGKGTQTYKDGDKYEGEYLNGYYHGKGTYFYENGNKYVGSYTNGKMNGEGVYTTKSGHKYVGHFVMGEFQGYGEYYFANGSVYKGMWVKSKMHGKAIMYYSDGDWYEGTFVKGQKKGKGTYHYKSGNVYVGKFANDGRHGAGVFTFFDGEVYEGKWKNDDGDKKFIELWNLKHHGKCVSEYEKKDVDVADFKIDLDSLKKVINSKINSDFNLAENILGTAFASGGFEEADKKFTELYEKDPKEVSILLYRGFLRDLSGRHRRAADDYQKILDKTGDINEILYLKGEALFSGAKDTAAALVMEKLMLNDSNKRSVCNYLGEYYTKKKRNYKLAEKYYLRALALAPGDFDSKENLLWVYATFNDTIKAQKLANELLSDCPGDLFITQLIANAYKSGKSYSTALKYYNQILNTPNLSKLMPADKIEKVYSSRGWTNLELKNYDDAKRDYEKALSTDSLNEQNWNVLAYIYVVERNTTKGLELVEKSIKVNPDYDWSYTTKAEAYMILGDDYYVYKNIEMALKNGLDDFSYFEDDEDHLYDKYKKEKRFIDLINKYKAQLEEEREK
jgi:predicted Zn-dependent protease